MCAPRRTTRSRRSRSSDPLTLPDRERRNGCTRGERWNRRRSTPPRASHNLPRRSFSNLRSSIAEASQPQVFPLPLCNRLRPLPPNPQRPPRRAQRRVRRDAEGRTEPAWRDAGRASDAVVGARDVVGRAARGASQHVAVDVSVHRDLVPGIGDGAGDARVTPRHLTEHEERRVPTQVREHLQELRRRRRVGAVR